MQVVVYLCTLHQAYSMFARACYLRYTGWSKVGKERVESSDVCEILAHSCEVTTVGSLKSTVQEDIAIVGGFGREQFR